MERFAAFFKKVLRKYKESVHNGPDNYRVIGTGGYAIVFYVDGAAYKISSELSYKEFLENQTINNTLKELGVNVPYIYYVYSVDDNEEFINKIKETATSTNLTAFVKKLSRIIYECQYDYAIESKKICGIYQEFINGTMPFRNKKPYELDSAFLEVSDEKNLNKKHREIKEKIKIHIDSELDKFLSVKDEHYIKFINDACAIQKFGIVIDNYSVENYIYNKNEGFYFIDLGKISNEQNFTYIECTILNVLNEVDYPNLLFSKESKEKYCVLFARLNECLKESYLQNIGNKEVKKQIKNYVEEVFRCDSYARFNEFLQEIPLDLQKKCKSSFDNSINIFWGNTLPPHNEPESA